MVAHNSILNCQRSVYLNDAKGSRPPTGTMANNLVSSSASPLIADEISAGQLHWAGNLLHGAPLGAAVDAVTSDPQLRSVGGRLRPSPSGPVANAAARIRLEVTHDIDGQRRPPSSRDIGADEIAGAQGSSAMTPLRPIDVGVSFLTGNGPSQGDAKPSRSSSMKTPPTDRSKLRILTYNVQFLPGLVSHRNERRRPLYRAEEIGRRLARYDVIGFNEVFDDRPRKRLLEAIKRSWDGDQLFVVRGPIATDGRLNGGLAIVSRFPFVATDSMIYRAASSPMDHGLKADGWVAKGVLHARISQRVDRKEKAESPMLDIFATHLEARVAKLRHQQIDELSAFVGENASGDHPIVMMGDFNTRGNSTYRADVNSPYRRLIAAMEKRAPRSSCRRSLADVEADERWGDE